MESLTGFSKKDLHLFSLADPPILPVHLNWLIVDMCSFRHNE